MTRPHDREAIPTPERPAPGLRQGEFVALMAMLSAVVAFGIDAMLPALPEIGRALTPGDLNRAQLIITSFVLGLGIGTFFTGPLSDRFGRRPVIVGGGLVYILGALIAWRAGSLEAVLAGRLVQGLGAAGPRVAALAMVRDLYEGRAMARIMSFVMLIFTLVPAIAPTLGWGIMQLAGWRGVFLAFVLFAAIALGWLMLRQPETLPVAARRPIGARSLLAATGEVFGHRTTRLSILVQTLGFGMLFGMLSSIQQIFAGLGEADRFHLWFGGIAAIAASGTLANAVLVGRFGMRAIVKTVLAAQVVLSLALILVLLSGPPQPWQLAAVVTWCVGLFAQAGLTIGNLNALAMTPVGHIAGLAASVIASVATVGAVVIAVPVGLAFDGTALPLAVAVALLAALGFAVTRTIRDAP